MEYSIEPQLLEANLDQNLSGKTKNIKFLGGRGGGFELKSRVSRAGAPFP